MTEQGYQAALARYAEIEAAGEQESDEAEELRQALTEYEMRPESMKQPHTGEETHGICQS